MKLITIKLPDEYIQSLNKIIGGTTSTRIERLRYAFRASIINEALLAAYSVLIFKSFYI